MIHIEIAYADQDHQELLSLQVPQGATVETAIERSGILEQFPAIDLMRHKVGIFSKVVSLNTLLQEGDRIEIYRPLQIDPKEARRRRAITAQQANQVKQGSRQSS
ncbi:MAG: RnfH family protein [Gammaproteobacteria bacterium]|nr:RnfH family protein [Gammaproteobacteria bacterium]